MIKQKVGTQNGVASVRLAKTNVGGKRREKTEAKSVGIIKTGKKFEWYYTKERACHRKCYRKYASSFLLWDPIAPANINLVALNDKIHTVNTLHGVWYIPFILSSSKDFHGSFSQALFNFTVSFDGVIEYLQFSLSTSCL